MDSLGLPPFVPKFMHIENRWGVITDDSTEELDLNGTGHLLHRSSPVQ